MTGSFFSSHGFKENKKKFFIPLPAIKMQLQVEIKDRTVAPALVSVFALIYLRELESESELKGLFYTLQGQQLRQTKDLSYLNSADTVKEDVLKLVRDQVSKEFFNDVQSVISGFEEVSEYAIVRKPSGSYQDNLKHGLIQGLWCSAGFVNEVFCGQVFIELTSVQFLRFKYRL